jgi:hypothetical protein
MLVPAGTVVVVGGGADATSVPDCDSDCDWACAGAKKASAKQSTMLKVEIGLKDLLEGAEKQKS